MMTLDEKVLAEAKDVRARLVELETQTAHTRVDYHHAIKKLHAAGGSLREIAEALELSHQRVHQVGEGGEPWLPGIPRPFSPRAKRALEQALAEATAAGREQFGPDEILIAIA